MVCRDAEARMTLTQIIKRSIAAIALAATATGCSYFNHIPDHKIQNVKPNVTEDAEWTKRYHRLVIGKTFLLILSGEPFDKKTPDELVKEINTPYEAQLYCLWLTTRNYPWKKEKYHYTSSFPITHKNAVSADGPVNDCSEAAVAAATLLNDNGYPPLMIKMCEKRYSFGKGHGVFLLKKDNKFHIIDANYRNRKYPDGFDSENDVVKTLYPEFPHYSVYDLSELYPDWKITKKNMQSRVRATTEVVK